MAAYAFEELPAGVGTGGVGRAAESAQGVLDAFAIRLLEPALMWRLRGLRADLTQTLQRKQSLWEYNHRVYKNDAAETESEGIQSHSL